jgi:hypothetical protein
VLLLLVMIGCLSSFFLHFQWGDRIALEALPALLYVLGSGGERSD